MRDLKEWRINKVFVIDQIILADRFIWKKRSRNGDRRVSDLCLIKPRNLGKLGSTPGVSLSAVDIGRIIDTNTYYARLSAKVSPAGRA